MEPLTGRRILVTGAAQNIGLAIARACLQEGARVLLSDVSQSSLDEALRSLGPDLACRSLTHAFDVRQKSGAEAAVTKMVAAWDGVDAVVNNAGIYPDRHLLDMAEEEWDQVMDINAKGTFLVSQAVAHRQVAQGTGGQIINISSGSYRNGRVGSGHYCASKAAVVMLTQVMAMELATHGIQVNSIAPGLIWSDHLSPEYMDIFARSIPMGRVGQPEDIAASVLMLLQSDCRYLSGQTILVDGALSAGRYGIPLSHETK